MKDLAVVYVVVTHCSLFQAIKFQKMQLLTVILIIIVMVTTIVSGSVL